MDRLAIVPAPRDSKFVELSKSAQGRVFRKQILNYGTLLYPDAPGGKVEVDEKFADTLIANFTNRVADIVQVPKAGSRNEHTEDPDRNTGEVIDLVKGPKGIYALMDIRTDDADKLGKTLLGTSAMLHLNYTDTRTGKRVGPTLLHNLITNRPYVVDLDPFEEVLAASRTEDDMKEGVLVLTPENDKEYDEMELDELLDELKTKHGIDVRALQASDTQGVSLSARLQEVLAPTGLLALSNTDGADVTTAIIAAVEKSADKIVELSGEIDTLRTTAATKDATDEVEKLVLSGHILPRDKEAMIELRKDKPDLFAKLVPEKPLVKLSNENGTEATDDSTQATAEAEIERIANAYDQKAKAFVRA